MEDTSGFYKYDEEQWFYAPNAVYAPTYTLLRELKDTGLSVDDLEPARNRTLKPRIGPVPPRPKLGKVLGTNNPKHIQAVNALKEARQRAKETPYERSKRLAYEKTAGQSGDISKLVQKNTQQHLANLQQSLKQSPRPKSASATPAPMSAGGGGAGGGGARFTTQSAMKSC